MSERKYDNGSQYRYGFNGKENDNEVKGEGNQQDYGMRIYDPRLGRFLSVDPITVKYPELTPYQFSSNRPIDGVDIDGLEHLTTQESVISISIELFEFNGKKVISGSVNLSALKNVTQDTYDYLTNPNRQGGATVATFKSPNFEEVLAARELAKAEALRRDPDMSDAQSNSIGQPEIYTPIIPQNNKEYRQQQKTGNFWNSAGVKSGAAKADGIMAMITIATDIVEFNHGNHVDEDFELGRSQLPEARKVLNDIQFGLDNNVFAPADLNDLYDYANFELDGTKPQRQIVVGHTKTGGEITGYIDDNQKLKRFYRISDNIIKRRNELTKPVTNETKPKQKSLKKKLD
jgi:RHS repeat-associated protein